MSNTAPTLRLVTAAPVRRGRREPPPDEHVVAVTLQPDDRLLLSVPEAARRLGISRSLFYEFIATGRIQTVHVGRLRKVSPAALDLFIDSLGTPDSGERATGASWSHSPGIKEGSDR
jgi:excisionase family DNA binding protein